MAVDVGSARVSGAGVALRPVIPAAPPAAPLAAVCDRMTDPLAVLDRDSRLIFANHAMLALLAAGDIVRLSDKGVAGATDAVRRALSEAIRAALANGCTAMAVASRPGRGRPLIFRVAPLEPDPARPVAAAAEDDCLLCLLIDDPARPHWIAVEDAIRLFGLTRGEAEVGMQIAAGLSVDAIARRQGVSRNTVRSHLAMLRDKLGVHSALAVAAEMRRAASPIA